MVAEMTGFSPGSVRGTLTGGAKLVPTDKYPAGYAEVTCGTCGVVFDVHRRTEAQRKAARRADQRQFVRWAGAVCAVSLASLVPAALFPYASGGERQLRNALVNSDWLICSIAFTVLSLACLLLVPVMLRTPEVAFKPRSKTGLHNVGLYKEDGKA